MLELKDIPLLDSCAYKAVPPLAGLFISPGLHLWLKSEPSPARPPNPGPFPVLEDSSRTSGFSFVQPTFLAPEKAFLGQGFPNRNNQPGEGFPPLI